MTAVAPQNSHGYVTILHEPAPVQPAAADPLRHTVRRIRTFRLRPVSRLLAQQAKRLAHLGFFVVDPGADRIGFILGPLRPVGPVISEKVAGT
ncbi:MAG TPA: hypothetical protein VE690_01365 [Rhodopila sp.]|nr:hypothetical protein [Rhodopila sp.]